MSECLLKKLACCGLRVGPSKHRNLSDQDPKRSPKAKDHTNSTKEFSEQVEGVTDHYPVKQGFRGKSHQEVHPNVR